MRGIFFSNSLKLSEYPNSLWIIVVYIKKKKTIFPQISQYLFGDKLSFFWNALNLYEFSNLNLTLNKRYGPYPGHLLSSAEGFGLWPECFMPGKKETCSVAFVSF